MMSKDPRTRKGGLQQSPTTNRKPCSLHVVFQEPEACQWTHPHQCQCPQGSHTIWQTDVSNSCTIPVLLMDSKHVQHQCPPCSVPAQWTMMLQELFIIMLVRLAEANADAMTQHACVNLAMPVDLYMRRLLDIVCCNMVTMIN